MKLIFTLATAIFFHFGTLAQSNQVAPKNSREVLILKENAFDFGKIIQGRPVSHEFEVTNGGTDSLVIDNVQTSCGCTTPLWEKSPMAPKGHSKITVGFNAGEEGPFEKSITVFYNNNQVKTLLIKGNVYKSAATSAPLNASVQLLKHIK